MHLVFLNGTPNPICSSMQIKVSQNKKGSRNKPRNLSLIEIHAIVNMGVYFRNRHTHLEYWGWTCPKLNIGDVSVQN